MSVVRLRMRWDEALGKLVEVPVDSRAPSAVAPTIWDDLPGYESPVTGLWVEGRRARREDLKRHGCRPHEGREQEAKQVARVRAENDKRMDAIAERLAHQAWNNVPQRVRRALRGW